MLTERDINNIAGTSDLEVSHSSDELGDDSDSLSDADCVGAIFTAQEKAYAGSGWTAVRDEEVRGNDSTIVYQTAVLFRSADKAQSFVDNSRGVWADCANTMVVRTTDEDEYHWQVGDFFGDPNLTLAFELQSGDDCQHALGVVSNLVVEAYACGTRISDEAAQMVDQMKKNAVEAAGTT